MVHFPNYSNQTRYCQNASQRAATGRKRAKRLIWRQTETTKNWYFDYLTCP